MFIDLFWSWLQWPHPPHCSHSHLCHLCLLSLPHRPNPECQQILGSDRDVLFSASLSFRLESDLCLSSILTQLSSDHSNPPKTTSKQAKQWNQEPWLVEDLEQAICISTIFLLSQECLLIANPTGHCRTSECHEFAGCPGFSYIVTMLTNTRKLPGLCATFKEWHDHQHLPTIRIPSIELLYSHSTWNPLKSGCSMLYPPNPMMGTLLHRWEEIGFGCVLQEKVSTSGTCPMTVFCLFSYLDLCALLGSQSPHFLLLQDTCDLVGVSKQGGTYIEGFS